MKTCCSPVAVLLLAMLSVPVASHAAEIYSCVDANGRRLTSDRPIAACLDREQRVLSRSGAVKRIIPPSYTPSETAALDARNKQEEAQRLQARARAKSMAALLQRYPNASSHMAARMLEAGSVTSRIREGYVRLEAIKNERAKLEEELAFYTKTPENLPAKLRLQEQAINESEKAANTYIFAQRQELVLLHKRYDAELALLETLWKQNP
ncbi:MAG: DUF4124 domain-containing protein [Brachymonas sp.]